MRFQYTCRSARGCSSVVERQLPKLNVEGSIPFTRFDALRCTGLHNVALCTELRTVETAGNRALVLHRIAHNCTRWRPARSHRRYRWRYAIRAGHCRLGPLPITPTTPHHPTAPPYSRGCCCLTRPSRVMLRRTGLVPRHTPVTLRVHFNKPPLKHMR